MTHCLAIRLDAEIALPSDTRTSTSGGETRSGEFWLELAAACTDRLPRRRRRPR